MMPKNLSLMDIFLDKSISEAGFGQIVPAQNVLVLAPHHDDEVLGCGGTIIRYMEQGAKVTIVYLTDGRYGVKTGDVEIRKDEALAAWSNYEGVRQIFCNYVDSKLSDFENDVIEFLKKTLKDLRPEIVFTPWIFDRHSDHAYTSNFLAASLEALEGQKCVIASYEVAFPLFANHTVNITKQRDKKAELIDKYKSQQQLNIKQFITSLNQYRAQLARLKSIKAAESFYLADADRYKIFIGSVFENMK